MTSRPPPPRPARARSARRSRRLRSAAPSSGSSASTSVPQQPLTLGRATERVGHDGVVSTHQPACGRPSEPSSRGAPLAPTPRRCARQLIKPAEVDDVTVTAPGPLAQSAPRAGHRRAPDVRWTDPRLAHHAGVRVEQVRRRQVATREVEDRDVAERSGPTRDAFPHEPEAGLAGRPAVLVGEPSASLARTMRDRPSGGRVGRHLGDGDEVGVRRHVEHLDGSCHRRRVPHLEEDRPHAVVSQIPSTSSCPRNACPPR